MYLNRDYKSRTPVHFAAQSGHSGLLITLLRAGGSPTCPDKIGYTPLHWASYNGNLVRVYVCVLLTVARLLKKDVRTLCNCLM